MATIKHHFLSRWHKKVLLTLLLLNLHFIYGVSVYILPSLQGGAGGGSLGSLFAQEVTVYVQPVQPVLPPQAGQYVDNPGKFFTVRLINNTDEQQQLHIGLQIEQRFPDNQLMVQSRYGHIPRVPIVLAPNQVKTLNPVEMKTLFTHYTLEDIYIKDGTYQDYKNGIFGLLPEGQYELFLTAYKWDPYLVGPVTLSDPKGGNTLFNVCYTAQPPRFLTPIQNLVADDPLSMFAVTKVNRNSASFTWTQPTLNCNATMVSFQYNARIVKLDGLSPDEAIERNPVVYERNRLTIPQLTIPEAYIRQMLADKAESDIFALQITATTTGAANSLNYTLIENEGKSPIYLFRLQDPTKESVTEEPSEPEKAKGEEDDNYNLTLEGSDENLEAEDSLYVFEQPILTQPGFENDPMGRKIYIGEDIKAEWRKAWYASGKGEQQDTVKFEYTVQLFVGNPADTPKGIFAGKPIVEHKTKELKDTIKWDDFKEKSTSGEYMILRVTAKSTNEKSIRMLGDSLNYVDFALTKHFDDDFACGNSTANVKNKELITQLPPKGTNLKINSWYLTLNDDCKLDAEEHTVSGTGWIAWNPMGTGSTMNCRVAVKFEKLKINTDNIVFDGKCQTYAKSSVKKDGYSAEQVVDSIFSQTGLDNIWGSLSLPEDVKNKVAKFAKDEAYDVAKAYKLGEYYGYLKTVQNKWENAKKGDILDLYFPVELPEQISSKLPKDFSVQIASMMFTPKSAVMNLIAMIALPNCDIIKDNDVLVFGCPRLCISPDRIFPEDGVLALLSNFKIQDPSSDFSLTFVAPSEPLNPLPNDGCFIRWENDEFGGLGLEIACNIPNTKRVVNGTVHDDLQALLDLRTVIRGNESAGDFIAYGSMTPFQVNDLPDWTFSVGEQIIFDHNMSENGKGMPTLNTIEEWSHKTFNAKECGTHVEKDWNAWQGVYVKDVSIGFPKFAVLGTGDKGVTIGAKDMIIDGSGITCKAYAKNILDAQTGKCGGWKFSIDEANVQIVQNNFDNCQIKGGFGIPLFGKKANEDAETSAKSEKKDEVETDVLYSCEIRHLTEPKSKEEYYTYDKDGNKQKHERFTYGDQNRYAYIFQTEQVNDLYMNCFVADLTVLKDQTYFVVAAEEQEDGKMKTDVELRMAGDITIANPLSDNKTLKSIAEKLPLKVSMPGIHFAKLRLSNFRYIERKNSLVYKYAKKKMDDAETAEANWEMTHTKLMTLAESKELELSKDKCYLDLGEWSLASVKKKLGPFSFELTDYDFGFDGNKLSLDISGKIGFCGDKVTAGAGIAITSDLDMPSDVTDIGSYKLSNGKVEFKSVTLDCDFASVVKLSGELHVVKDSTDAVGNKLSGYAGAVDCEIKGLFEVNCDGGYFTVTETDAAKIKEIKADAKEEGVEEYAGDNTYSYGYFMVSIKSGAGIRIDPLVINRIAGGFYFNCRPKWNDSKKEFETPIAEYGAIGISLGMGFATSAGEDVLNADVDLNVIYKRNVDGKGGRLTTFLFKGDVKAASGMIDAKMVLLYQNDDTDRFLSLDITVTAGLGEGKIGKWMEAANKELEAVQEQLNKFQEDLDAKVKDFVPSSNGSLEGALNDDGDHAKSTASQSTDNIDADAKKKAEDAEKSKGMTVSLPFQLKITWKEKGVEKTPVRWHLYLGEPEKDKRCKIILLDYKSKIVNVNIGADAYLCIGNELPGNGQLPAIPTEITNFLNPSGVDTGADMAKAQRSRNAACRSMMGTDVRGGLMVGASAWGFIDIDLGLFYGGLKAIAGFDMALVNYGDAAYCVNLKQPMGKDGWYATGQFYAYLAANFGLHIKLGKLIDRHINIVDAGIGGVFQAGLPSPTWIDGRARVKLSLLGGLIDINKSFHFECGDYCEAFVGNALDGFSLFGDCNIAADSLKEGWKEENAIAVREGNKMMINTQASLNSQYRLVDPSTQKALAEQTGEDPESLKLNAARTYIFDFDKNKNEVGWSKDGVKGARLLEISASGVEQLNKNQRTFKTATGSKKIMAFWEDFMNSYWKTREMSIIMASKSMTSGKTKDSEEYNLLETYLQELRDIDGVNEIPISIRETQGTRYHLKASLKPDHYYILVLTGTAFEVENGERCWVQMTEKNKKGQLETNYQQWIQRKFFYFRTKATETVPAVPTDLKPYVALAYPSGDDLSLFNTPADEAVAYDGDLACPTIALNQDISGQAYQDGLLYWEFRKRAAGTETWQGAKKYENEWRKYDDGTCVNMVPKGKFNVLPIGKTAKKDMEYNLRLTYQYKVDMKCSTGLEPNATNEELWASYRRFLKRWGLEKKFITYKDAQGYSKYGLDDNYDSRQCMIMVKVVRNFIDQNSLATKNWDKWVNGDAANVEDCKKDTVICLMDLYFRGTDNKSWMTQGSKTSGSSATWISSELLPYEKPFVGVRPEENPVYTYDALYNTARKSGDPSYLDDKVCFRNSIASQFNRTDDPYFYFAYLSNWVFPAGLKLSAYDFDEVEVRHATETLTFNYNGVDVQGSALIKGMNGKVIDVRDRMYATWNDWYSNNSSQPKYPLPTGEGKMFELTHANQDGKTSSLVAAYDTKAKDYQYPRVLKNYIQDFAAPYYVASTLDSKMAQIANTLYNYYYDTRKKYGGNMPHECNVEINDAVKQWSALHRGQYLTVESRGFKVKVPYYQFPLIFGDCFGQGTTGDPMFGNKGVDRYARSFAFSVREGKMDSERYNTKASNLMFWRLVGGFPWAYYSESAYSGSYPFQKGYRYVNHDIFSPSASLQKCTSMKVKLYRVNSYNINTGQYTFNDVGAARDSEYENWFTEKTVDPIKDSGSNVRGTAWNWLQLVGSPKVTSNSTVVEDSFDKEEEKK